MLYQTLLLLIGIVTGFVTAYVIYGGFKYRDVVDEQGEKPGFFRRGIVAHRMHKKGRNLEKVLRLLKERGELSNADIRKALGVSARTVVNYMDHLEKEEKVEQVGNIGQSVTYRLKK